MTRTATILLLLLATLALAADKLTVKQLQADTKKYDQKEITLTGKVDKFKQKTSRAGNAYFTFSLQDPADKKIDVNVYGQGKAEKPPKDGDLVEVKGTYRLEKNVGGNTFKNEIQIKPDAIKVLTPAK
jgi:DNA polymerase III alpha subunit